jgi:hypothetical protein
MRRIILVFIFIVSLVQKTTAQQSVARRWNEVQLKAIRQDQARPPVQARNLYHVNMAMYDAWAVYKGYAKTYLLGKTLRGIYYPFTGLPPVPAADTVAYQNKAISYAAYRVLRKRYSLSPNPNASTAMYRFDTLMLNMGYDTSIKATTYNTGNPAHLGNYIAAKVLQMGLIDSCREATNYNNLTYTCVNDSTPLITYLPGSGNMSNPNRWQPLYIYFALDQNNIPVGSKQKFLTPEWGRALPFSLVESTAIPYVRNGATYPVYKDPGVPPTLNLTDVNDSMSAFFKWGHAMVTIWSSMLDPNDSTMIDISPHSLANNNYYPSSFSGQQSFYHYLNGGDSGKGHTLNPVTNMPYTPQNVKLGDYTRVVSQYWADGPNSETPPGHWFVLLNEVSDHPLFQKRYEGIGDILSNLEWDIKSYFTLGASMHDAAVACWGIKGWYDAPRPISAIRKMAEFGQSSDSTLPHYHPGGLPLVPGYIELVTATDSIALADTTGTAVNKIKVKAWRGFRDKTNPLPSLQAPTGVGWILAEDWMPYQRKTFVTPPFGGYLSGHSTYSRAGATVMTKLTGNPFFPGGLLQKTITPAQNFLVFETGPSSNITLQWATYKDASDQASLSRIWGGIHPPFDDIKGRLIGEEIGNEAFDLAKYYFNNNFPLPVTIVNFAAVENNCKVNLSWEVALEENVERYEIWRSIDGIDFDTKIGEVKANGSKIGEQYYSFVDVNPLPSNYYKLVGVDQDNKLSDNKVSYVNMKTCQDVNIDMATIYPNPVVNKININIHSSTENETAKITITDMIGRLITVNSTLLNAKNEVLSLQTNKLATGNYFISIELGNGYSTKYKFTKAD